MHFQNSKNGSDVEPNKTLTVLETDAVFRVINHHFCVSSHALQFYLCHCILELCRTWPAVTPPTLLELCRGWPAVTPPTVVIPWVQSVHCMHNLPSPIRYNGLTHTVLSSSRQHAYSYIQQSCHCSVISMNAKNTKKSPIHENTDVNITCGFGDGDISRYRSWLPHGQPYR